MNPEDTRHMSHPPDLIKMFNFITEVNRMSCTEKKWQKNASLLLFHCFLPLSIEKSKYVRIGMLGLLRPLMSDKQTMIVKIRNQEFSRLCLLILCRTRNSR